MVYSTDFEIDRERIEKEIDDTISKLKLLSVEIKPSDEFEEKLNDALEKSEKARRTYFRNMRFLNWLTFILWTATGIINLCSESISKFKYGIVWGVLLITFLVNAYLHRQDSDIYVFTKD